LGQQSTLKDLTGSVFGRLTVIGRSTPIGIKPIKWECECTCGERKTIMGTHLKSGHTKSCGCLSLEIAQERMTTHGKRKSVLYYRWRGLINRCNNPKDDSYKWYGGRGITICDRWLKFENFLADMGEPPEGKWIERVDNNKGYSPDNCEWVSPSENCKNRKR
jgi:hypothetical protein